jgi:hypothetical protein
MSRRRPFRQFPRRLSESPSWSRAGFWAVEALLMTCVAGYYAAAGKAVGHAYLAEIERSGLPSLLSRNGVLVTLGVATLFVGWISAALAANAFRKKLRAALPWPHGR